MSTHSVGIGVGESVDAIIVNERDIMLGLIVGKELGAVGNTVGFDDDAIVWAVANPLENAIGIVEDDDDGDADVGGACDDAAKGKV
jgi:hypothetical protein